MQSAFPSGLDKLVAEITASSWTTCYNLYLAHPALCCCFSLLLGAVSLTQTVLCLCCPFLPLGLVHGSRLDPSIHICTDTFLPVLLACTGTGMKWEWQEHRCLGDSQLSCLIWRWRDTGDRNELLFWCGARRKYGLAAALRFLIFFWDPDVATCALPNPFCALCEFLLLPKSSDFGLLFVWTPSLLTAWCCDFDLGKWFVPYKAFLLAHLALCFLRIMHTRASSIFWGIKSKQTNKKNLPFSCREKLYCFAKEIINGSCSSRFFSVVLLSACSEPQAGEHFCLNPRCSHFSFRIRMLSLGWLTETNPFSYRGLIGCLRLSESSAVAAYNPHLLPLPSVCQVASLQRHIWETQNPCLEWFSQTTVQWEKLGRQQGSGGGRNKCDGGE